MLSPIILFLSPILPFIAAIPYTPQAYNRLIDLPSALPPNLHNTLDPYSVSSSPHIPSPNISTDSTPSSSNDLVVQCLPARYGAKIPLADCIDAVSQIMPDGEIHDWADRHGGFVKQHFPLPFRFMGRAAQCYIEPRLLDSASRGSASLSMVLVAADAIVKQCSSTTSRRVNGGIAYGIGGNNALTVTLAAYKGPLPTCRGVFKDEATALKCTAPLYGMEAGKETLSFGSESAWPRPDVVLPAVVRSMGDECVVRVFGSTDEAQWYNMWEAAVAVFSVCVRGAKGGVVRNLGESAFLKMEVADVTSIYV